MRSIYAATVFHMRPEIIAFSLTRARKTHGLTRERELRWFTLDNCWPGESHELLTTLAGIVSADHCAVEKNVGAHGGISYLIEKMKASSPITEDDYILTYDPDSNPIQHGWLDAMAEVLDRDDSIPYISLMPMSRIMDRCWQFTDCHGYKLAQDRHPEMFNVTLWRAKHLWNGLKSTAGFYGYVELYYWNELGLKGSYLYDWREGDCPIPHAPLYTEWKRKHVAGVFKGNFDAYWNESGRPPL